MRTEATSSFERNDADEVFYRRKFVDAIGNVSSSRDDIDEFMYGCCPYMSVQCHSRVSRDGRNPKYGRHPLENTVVRRQNLFAPRNPDDSPCR